VLATIAAALWVVVVMRLAIPVWLRALSASICFFALAIIATAMAISNVTISQVNAKHPVFFSDDGSIDTHLTLGYTPRAMASLRVDEKAVFVDLHNRPGDVTVIGQESVAGFLASRTPKGE
jgi:hypothetical protein